MCYNVQGCIINNIQVDQKASLESSLNRIKTRHFG